MIEASQGSPSSGAALAALLLSVATVSAGYGIVLPILPLMLQEIDGPNAATEVARHTGLLTAVHALALFLFAPVWGWLSDHQGRRVILIVGLVGFSVSLLLSTIRPTIGVFYAERFFTGLFASAIAPVASAVIADHGGSDAWRARHLAWVSMASVSGFLLGPMLSGFLATLSTVVSSGGAVARQSYELPFLAVSIVALLAASAVRIWVPSCNATSSADQIQSRLSFDPNVRTIWRLRTIGFVVAIGIGAFEVGLTLRGSQDLGMGPRQVALMFTACSLVMFVVQAAVFSPMVAPASTRWFIMPALITMAVALILVPRTTDFTALLAIVAVVAASAGILSPILTYWVSLEGGTSKGAELGKQTAVTSLGQALGSLVGASFFASAILQGAPFLISSILLAAAAIACWRLPRRLGHTRASLSGFAPGKNPHVSSSSTNH